MKTSRLLTVSALLACSGAYAQSDSLLKITDNKPLDEVWLNAGFYSYHFQRDKGLNDGNSGFGAEYRFSAVSSLTAGRFRNSERKYSNYAGIYYQPIMIGPVRLGAVIGGFNGYPKAVNGGWFLAAIPAASVEYQRLGVNLTIVPSYKDRLYGAVSIQFKLKIFD